MNKVKAYRDSLLSVLCIVSWVVIAGRIFTSPRLIDENLMFQLIGTWLLTILIAVVGGVVLLFYGLLIKRSLKYSFIYNLFGTLNIMTGTFGMTLLSRSDKTTPYLVAASFTIGIVMYKSIFRGR